MTWVVWRQQRGQLLVSLGVVAATAVALVIVSVWRGTAVNNFISLDAIRAGLWLLPSLLGILAGAPLFAGELDRGTHVFGLTQSVSRRRWVVTKLLVAGVPIVAAMTGLGMATAWAATKELGANPFDNFATDGIVLGGYTALAFSLAVAIGAWWRNVIVAAVLTLVVMAVLAPLFRDVTRPNYVPPVPVSVTIDEYAAGESPATRVGHAWQLDFYFEDDAGNDLNEVTADCVGDYECAADGGVTKVTLYTQPYDRYWAFQGIETGITVAASAAALGLGAWGLRRTLR